MPAAVTGTFKLVGSPHWTSGPLGLIPQKQHATWSKTFTKADSVLLGKMKKRVVPTDTRGIFFPTLGEAGYFQDGATIVLVSATGTDESLKDVLKAATQVDVADTAWKPVAVTTFTGKHVLWNAWAKDLQGEAIRDRKRAHAVPVKTGVEYLVEEIRAVPFRVKVFPNQKPVDVTYSFTRLRPAGGTPAASKARPAALPPVASELVASPELTKHAKALRFVDSDQTTMVVMPAAALPRWGGLASPDYTRACAVSGLGLIDVGGKTNALVIGMDSAMAFHPTPTGGLILMWVGADSAAGVLTLALSIPDKQWKKSKVVWDVGDGKLVMIGAPTVGSKAGRARVDIKLTPGTYRVESCWGFRGDVRVGKATESVNVSALRLVRA